MSIVSLKGIDGSILVFDLSSFKCLHLFEDQEIALLYLEDDRIFNLDILQSHRLLDYLTSLDSSFQLSLGESKVKSTSRIIWESFRGQNA